MELLERKRRVSTSENLESSEFTIKASPKAFKILSSGLYSDKIKAIIRELSTNAYDAHIVAGHTNQFDVHLPTPDEPNFYIRDYGPGIAKDDITSIYTKYFESNKTDSNDLVGCLGLGSKSPFAYTNDFIVTSIHDGVKCTYSAFIGQNGYPSIAKMGEENTTEPSGLKVEFLVKVVDMTNFYMKAGEVYKYFNIAPKFIGRQLKIEKHAKDKTLPSGPDWYFCEESTTALAVMGNVAYPIKLSDATLSPAQQQLLSSNLCINFKIGDVDIEASREGLSYDNRTILNIKIKLQSIIDFLNKEVSKQISNAKCAWDASVLYYETLSRLNKVVKLDNVQYQGKPINTNSIRITNTNPAGWALTYYMFEQRYSWNNDSLCRSDNFMYIHPASHVQFFIADIKRGSIERVKQYVRTELGKGKKIKALLVHPDDNAPNEFADFCKIIGLPEDRFVKTSTLPAVVRTTNRVARGKGDTDTVLKYTPTSVANTSWVGFDHTKLPKNAIYVPISNWAAVNDKGERLYNHIDISTIIESVQGLSGKKIEVFGVRAKKEDWLKDNYTVIHLVDYIKQLTYTHDVAALTATAGYCSTVNSIMPGEYMKLIKHYNFPKSYKNLVSAIEKFQSDHYTTTTPLISLQMYWRNLETVKTGKELVQAYGLPIPASPSPKVQQAKKELDEIVLTHSKLFTPLVKLVFENDVRYRYGSNNLHTELKELTTYLS